MIRVLIFALLVLLFSCTKPAATPSIPDEEIAAIMADLCSADAATHGLTGFEKDSLSQIYYEQVFKIHHTTKEEHNANLRIVCQDVLRMEQILNKSEEILKEQRQKLHAK